MVTSLWNAIVTVSDVVPPVVWFSAAVALIVWTGRDLFRAWSSVDNDPPEVTS